MKSDGYQALLSPRAFLRLTPAERRNIKKTEIVPPRLGSGDFGKIRVFYKTPVFKVRRLWPGC